MRLAGLQESPTGMPGSWPVARTPPPAAPRVWGQEALEQAPSWEPRGGRTVMTWPTLHRAARPAHPSVHPPSVLAWGREESWQSP